MREAGSDDSQEDLEKERQAAQEFIDNADPLTEEEQAEKESLIKQGFETWSKRDFQQFIRALESYGWYYVSIAATPRELTDCTGLRTLSCWHRKSLISRLGKLGSTTPSSKRSGKHFQTMPELLPGSKRERQNGTSGRTWRLSWRRRSILLSTLCRSLNSTTHLRKGKYTAKKRTGICCVDLTTTECRRKMCMKGSRGTFRNFQCSDLIGSSKAGVHRS